MEDEVVDLHHVGQARVVALDLRLHLVELDEELVEVGHLPKKVISESLQELLKLMRFVSQVQMT